MGIETRLRELVLKLDVRIGELRSRLTAVEAASGGGGGGPVAWADVTGKPSLFPPEAHVHPDATALIAGFLAAADKSKLDGIAAGATVNAPNSELRDRSTHTGTQSLDTTTDSATRLAMAAVERTKLAGIATGATANDTDANLKNRANHTGSQAISTVAGLQVALDGLQPSDADLTAIAALATTAFGRGFLDLADAAAARTKMALGSAALAASGDFQPTDADLTAIAALTTTAFGRGFLDLVDAAAARTKLALGTAAQSASGDFQAADSDLAAIAALATTSFGRSLLTQADAAALRTLLGLVVGTDVQAFDQQLADLAGLSYAGNASKVVRVNAAANGFELATLSAGGGQPLPTVYRLTANHSNSTVTPTTITDGTTPWTHTLVAGKTYRFTIWGTYQAAALTTGGRMNLLGAGGLAGTVAGMMWGAIVQAAAASTLESPIYSFANGAGAFLLTTAVNPINAPHIWGADFVFHCTTGGTLSLQWASEVAASAAQLNSGSVMMVEELN